MTIDLTNSELLDLQSLYKSYKVADNAERGWNADDVSTKRTAYYNRCDELGLSVKIADMLCWYTHVHFDHIVAAAKTEKENA